MPLVSVYEVYSQSGSNCVAFLTEDEAQKQTLIVPFDGPYPAGIYLTEDELVEMMTQRYLCV